VMDGIVYCVAAAAGFATVENIMYVAGGGLATGIVRALVSVPLHVLASAMVGYFLGLSKFKKSGRTVLILTGLVLAIALHGTFDFFLLKGRVGIALLVVPLVIGAWFAVGRLVHRSLDLSPFKPGGALAPHAHHTRIYIHPVRPKPAHYRSTLKVIGAVLLFFFSAIMSIGAIGVYIENSKEITSNLSGYIIMIFLPIGAGALLLIGAARGQKKSAG
jgi:hypothetical protein